MKIKNCFYFRRAAAACTIFCHPNVDRCRSIRCTASGNRTKYGHSYRKLAAVFPGLEGQINAAFEEGRKTGNFIFHSNAAPVAWNVSENGTIAVNSINAGYFRSLRNPANHQFLFPGLSVESQNVNISAGRDLIVTPVPVAEKGFGYALSVGRIRLPISAPEIALSS